MVDVINASPKQRNTETQSTDVSTLPFGRNTVEVTVATRTPLSGSSENGYF